MIEVIDRRAAYRLRNLAKNHPIPKMDHPLSSGWKQPARILIEIDDTHAAMSQAVFDELHEYSCSSPSGVYPGKMWSRHDGAFDRAFLARGGKPEWLLCWYDVSEHGPEWCSTKTRKILII